MELPNTKKELIVLIIFLQFFLNSLVSYLNSASIFSLGYMAVTNKFLVIINLTLALLTIYLIYAFMKLIKKEQMLASLQHEQKNNENLSQFLRELKHDLNNQLFVVNGFLQLGKVEEAAAYAEELSEQFDWMEALLKLNQPGFASLVLNKMMEAKNQGAEVEVNIATEDISKIPKEIITRTVGNLLDNAVEAMSNNHIEPKQLVLEMYPKKDYLLISVENTGKVPLEIAENMFQKGFSTKGNNKEHGLGLHIVKTLMDGIGGKITFENKEGITIFQLYFPVKPA